MTGMILMLVLLGIIPVFIGSMAAGAFRRENGSCLAFVYLMGIMILVAVMQLLSVPMTFMRCSFSLLVWIYNGITAVLLIFAIVCRRKQLMEIGKESVYRIRNADRRWILVIAAIYLPVIAVSFYTPYIYGDDTTYITMVNDILSSDTLYQIDVDTGQEVTWVLAKYSLSAYWTWIAYLAKMSGLHPLFLCKTVLIYFFVPMAYAVQGLLGSFLFRNQERKMIVYMLFVVLVSIFGGFSNYTVTYRLYTWVWQSKAFLAIIVLPFLFYYCNCIFEYEISWRENVLLLTLILATCSTTLTGTGLAVGMVLVLALIYAVKNKNIKNMIFPVLACFPAYVLMAIYLRYDQFLGWIHF
jgi:hypothetical protein